MSNVSIKLELTKMTNAVISDGYICIPLPAAGTGAQGLFLNQAGDRVYCDLVAWENRDGQDAYGNDYSVKPSASKAEKDAQVQLPFVGNARNF